MLSWTNLSKKKLSIGLTVQQYKSVNNCRFFSATGYKYMDEDMNEDMNDYSDSDSNSEISRISNKTIDSKTSDPDLKLYETRKRIEHNRAEAISSNREIVGVSKEIDKLTISKEHLLSPEDKLVYDSTVSRLQKIVDDSKAKPLNLSNPDGSHDYLGSRLGYLRGSTNWTEKVHGLSWFRSKFIHDRHKDSYDINEENTLTVSETAKRNFIRDSISRRENIEHLKSREEKLKEVLNKKDGTTYSQGGGQGTTSTQGSLPVAQENNVAPRQSGSSLLDDFADLSQEMPDYFGGDD